MMILTMMSVMNIQPPVKPDSEFEIVDVKMEHTQDVKCVAWHPSEEVRLFLSPSPVPTPNLLISKQNQNIHILSHSIKQSLFTTHARPSTARFSPQAPTTTPSNSTKTTPTTISTSSRLSTDTLPPSGPSHGSPHPLHRRHRPSSRAPRTIGRSVFGHAGLGTREVRIDGDGRRCAFSKAHIHGVSTLSAGLRLPLHRLRILLDDDEEEEGEDVIRRTKARI